MKLVARVQSDFGVARARYSPFTSVQSPSSLSGHCIIKRARFHARGIEEWNSGRNNSSNNNNSDKRSENKVNLPLDSVVANVLLIGRPP